LFGDLSFLLPGIHDKVGITGRVIATVYGPDGRVKQRSISHNIVTDEGDAMIADQMADTPARTKVNNANGYIEVGTGYAGGAKAQTALVTPTGSPEAMDATYPKVKGAFGAANDNVTQYQATFEAGDLNATGINEAGLINNAVEASADMLAYAQVTPTVNAGLSDTLQILWELTYLGA
jgi:hypothetical protein